MLTNTVDSLVHHGIKGQKWGIRRYQNFDGTYTKAGLKRYSESVDRYEQKKQAYKSIKNSGESRYNKQMAKAKMKEAKQQVNKDYKHLAQDKLADKGKVRYYSGERIRGNWAVERAMRNVGSLALTGAAAMRYFGVGSKKAQLAVAAIGGTSFAALGVTKAVNYKPNKELRAYYNHTSNY